MKSVSVQALLTVAALLTCSCGGGGNSGPTSPTTPAAPSSPATPPSLPSGGVCAIVGGPAFGSQGILNGTACSSATSPVVLVNLYDSTGFVGSCTGTVIAPRAVLTAAHCLVGDTASIKLYLGSGDPVAAVSFTPSPDYHGNDSASLDVGVVLTGQDMDRSPVPLLSSRDAVVGETAVIVGWGKDQSAGSGTTLRAGSTTITAVGANFLETPSTTGNSGVCSGDSGGPILLSQGGVWSVAGVTSAGATGGSCTIGPYYFANIRNARIIAFVLGLVPNAIRQ